MSDIYFYHKFSSALTEILEQYQQELYPDTPGNKGQKISKDWSCKDWLNFYVALYIKYIDILKKVEDCYDQTTHPQVRKYIKSFLVNLLCRVAQVKKSLIFYNNPIIEVPSAIPYVFLDDYLVEMKLEPENLVLPIPRYYREDDDYTLNRNVLIDQRLKEKYGNCLPEEDKQKFFFEVNLNLEESIKILQNFEMGRQNLKRISKALKLAHKKVDSDLGGDNNKIMMEDERKRIVVEHLVALYKVRKTRDEELKFLKVFPDESMEDNLDIRIAEENRKNRKVIQAEKNEDYKKHKEKMAKNIEEIEGYEIFQDMVKQRKDWMEKEKQTTRDKPPQSIDQFYLRNNVENKVQLDEQQKKVVEANAKDKLKKEQDKKKKEEGSGKIQLPIYDGPSQQAKKLTELTEVFKQKFETPSEFINKNETFIEDIARGEVIDQINNKIRLQVDAMIDIEIKNRFTIFNKGKKPKPSRKKVPKVPSDKLGPGEKAIAKMDTNELLSDIVTNGVVRKMVPKYLEDLQADFNYNAQAMNLVEERMIDIPLFYTKQLIKEYCIYPLGTSTVKLNNPNIPSVLFFGPPGSGKTHAALAVAYHTNALFIDLSPRNFERFTTKEEVTRMVASAFRVARTNQPAVIYFDNAEQIFVDTKKVKKGAVKNANAMRLKKLLISYKNLVNPTMRILFIGCTNKGWHMNTKDLNTMFDKSLSFSLPSFSDRMKIWKKEIQKRIGRNYDMEYDTLGQLSNGFSAESIVACIDYTLTPYRLEKVKFSPLQVDEFISALSKTQYMFKDDLEENANFLYEASGLKAVHAYLQKKREENEKNTKKK